jgi:hypothetical protein
MAYLLEAINLLFRLEWSGKDLDDYELAWSRIPVLDQYHPAKIPLQTFYLSLGPRIVPPRVSFTDISYDLYSSTFGCDSPGSTPLTVSEDPLRFVPAEVQYCLHHQALVLPYSCTDFKPVRQLSRAQVPCSPIYSITDFASSWVMRFGQTIPC